MAVAQGVQRFLGNYSISRARRVLFIDGELPLAELQARLLELCRHPPDNLDLLSSEDLFRAGIPLNINSPSDQDWILAGLDALEAQGRRPDLIILDNLSALSSGNDENDNSEQELFLKFLIGLRHAGLTVLFLHHAGKGGDQRGASRREDLLDTVIKLEKSDRAEPSQGARFKLSFTKTRGKVPVPDELDCELQDVDGVLTWTTARAGVARPTEVLKYVLDHRPAHQKDIARALGLSRGRISQMIKELRRDGLLERKGLEPSVYGRSVLADEYPDAGVEVQGDLEDVM